MEWPTSILISPSSVRSCGKSHSSQQLLVCADKANTNDTLLEDIEKRHSSVREAMDTAKASCGMSEVGMWFAVVVCAYKRVSISLFK